MSGQSSSDTHFGTQRLGSSPAVQTQVVCPALERSMRGPVVGRKNHYGSRSKRGTEVAAQLYSLLECCKLARVNPAAYLREAVLAGLREKHIALPHEWVPLTTAAAP